VPIHSLKGQAHLARRRFDVWCGQLTKEQGTIKLSTTIFGIKNCDTMKKARAWLDDHGVTYTFHDYKAEGVGKDQLKSWSDQVGWETLLNRAGTTFRKLPEADKEGLNERKAIALMLAQPSMIKRPVLEAGAKLLVGFKPEIYAKEVATSGKSTRKG
jgi:arsenate reductase (glutaredoxin)